MEKKGNERYNFVIISWVVLFILSELIMIFNLVGKGNKDNIFDFLISIFLIALIYVLGICFSVRLKKKELLICEKKGAVLIIILHFLLALATFVGLAEASLDSKTTTEQVKNVIMFLKGEKKDVYIESFEIEIDDKKDVYEIGDVIYYETIITPKKANVTAILYNVNNEIVEIDTYNKTITCLKNGKCEIVFYDNYNNDITYSVDIEINSVVTENILINGIDYENSGTLYLNTGEEYKLNAVCVPSNAVDIKLEYISSDSSNVVVDSEGVIRAIDGGSSKITITNGSIKKEMYVFVDAISEIVCKVDELDIYPGFQSRQSIVFKVNNAKGFESKWLKIENPNGKLVNITRNINVVENWFGLVISSNLSDEDEDISFDIIVKYGYPNGMEYEKVIRLNLLSEKDVNVSDIDLDKTEVNIKETIYYNDDGLITRTISNPIYYLVSSKVNNNRLLFESEDNIDLSASRYNKLLIGLKELDLSKDYYEVKFYPNKKKDEYITFKIELEYQKVSSNDSSFEMDYLYEESEGKKNEIWFSYFNESIFERVSFNNSEFNNSGIMIFISEESKEHLDFEVNEYGLITSFKFKNTSLAKTPRSCTLSFDICSLYEYNKNYDCDKYRYVIDVVSNFDDVIFVIGDKYEISDKREIYAVKGEVLTIDFISVVDLEYKGYYQTYYNIYGYEIVSSDNNIVTYSNEKLYCNEYGVATVNLFLKSSFFSETHPVYITFYVTNEEGVIPKELRINLDIKECNENFMPDGNKYSVGSVLKISANGSGSYKYSVSNSEIISIDDNGNIVCLKEGTADIICEDTKTNEKVVKSISVFDKVYPFEILKGDFKKVSYENGVYVISCKTKKMYLFSLGDNNDSQMYSYYIDNESGYELSKNGSVVFNKEGNYTGYIVCGDENSPYKVVVKFKVEVLEDGIAATFKYFVRKLVGHFGYFLGLGALTFIVFVMANGFKINKFVAFIVVCLFGMFMAFTTEYIQKTDPTRYYAFSDMVLDIQGYFIGVGIMVICYFVYKLIIRGKLRKVE